MGPAAHDAQAAVRADVRRVGVESMSWKQRQELPEDCAMMAQGLDLL